MHTPSAITSRGRRLATAFGLAASLALGACGAPAQSVAAVTVSASSLTLDVGESGKLSATAADASGRELRGASITWRSANPAIATVDASGMVRAVAPGLTGITAAVGQRLATATVTVLAPAVGAAKVPSAQAPIAAAEPPARSQPVETARESRRGAARDSQRRASASRRAAAPPVARPLPAPATPAEQRPALSRRGDDREYPNEPAGFEVITERAFSHKAKDDKDRGPRGSEGWDGAEFRTGNFSIVRDPTAPKSPPFVAQFRYPQGFRGGRSPGLAQVAFRRPVRDLYLSLWIKLSPNWEGHRSNTNKMFFLWVNGGNRVFVSAEGKGQNRLQPQIRLQGRDIPDQRPRLPPNVQPGAEVRRGVWQRWELVVSPNTPGANDGRIRWWIDGQLVSDYRDVGFIRSGEGVRWDQLQWSATWGGGGDSVPADQFIWWDHVYVSGR